MHNYQLNMRSCHCPDCDYGKESFTPTLAIHNFSSWTGFPQISIEMEWELGNSFWEVNNSDLFFFSTFHALEPKLRPFSANLFRSFFLVPFLSFVAHFIVILSYMEFRLANFPGGEKFYLERVIGEYSGFSVPQNVSLPGLVRICPS